MTLTFELDLDDCKDEPKCQIYRSKVISFKKIIFLTRRHTHPTVCSTWTTKTNLRRTCARTCRGMSLGEITIKRPRCCPFRTSNVDSRWDVEGRSRKTWWRRGRDLRRDRSLHSTRRRSPPGSSTPRAGWSRSCAARWPSGGASSASRRPTCRRSATWSKSIRRSST